MDKNQGLGALAAREAVNRPDHYGGGDNSRDEWDAMAEVTRRPLPIPAERGEVDALLAEVERLRGEAERERAAVVAYLDDMTQDCFLVGRHREGRALTFYARRIESGEHRCEGGE